MGWTQPQAPNTFPNQHFMLSHIRKDIFFPLLVKCGPPLKIIIETVHILTGEGNLWPDMKWLLPSPLLILKYFQLVFKIFSYCSNLKIIWISIFLLTVVLWFFPLLSQVWISGNGHHSFLCLVVFLGCQWQEKCMH